MSKESYDGFEISIKNNFMELISLCLVPFDYYTNEISNLQLLYSFN